MNDDTALLRRYAEENSDTAFTELVGRHVDLVYGAAMRRTGGDTHLSADIAQHVFTALARHARTLSRHPALAAWLHTATRNAALKLMISEQRRRTRESAANLLNETNASGDTLDWERLRPLLDTEIDRLPEADRTSLVLRFFEQRPFAEIAAALRVSEDAARMRTERAIEKLRAALSRRGIASSAAALTALVSAQAATPAPAGLATALAAQSLASAGAGLATFMTAKIIIPAVLSALAAFSVGTYLGLSQKSAPPPVVASGAPKLQQTVDALRSENQQLHAEVTTLATDLAHANDANAALKTAAVPPPPPRHTKSPTLGLERYEVQQAVLNNLRQIASARDQYIVEKGHPPAALGELVGRGRFIKTVRTVGGEDYADLAMTPGGVLSVTTPDGVTVTYDPSGVTTTKPDVPPQVAQLEQTRRRLEPVVNQAIAAYIAANAGKRPLNEQALLPYFTTPQDGADFLEYVEASKAPAAH